MIARTGSGVSGKRWRHASSMKELHRAGGRAHPSDIAAVASMWVTGQRQVTGDAGVWTGDGRGRWRLGAAMHRPASCDGKRKRKCIGQQTPFALRPVHFRDGIPLERKSLCICAMACQRPAVPYAFLARHANRLLTGRRFLFCGGIGSQKLKCPLRKGA